jgi:hypothetical protein
MTYFRLRVLSKLVATTDPSAQFRDDAPLHGCALLFCVELPCQHPPVLLQSVNMLFLSQPIQLR